MREFDGESDSEVVTARRAKLGRIRARGSNPFANDVGVEHPLHGDRSDPSQVPANDVVATKARDVFTAIVPFLGQAPTPELRARVLYQAGALTAVHFEASMALYALAFTIDLWLGTPISDYAKGVISYWGQCYFPTAVALAEAAQTEGKQ